MEEMKSNTISLLEKKLENIYPSGISNIIGKVALIEFRSFHFEEYIFFLSF